jgi:hypothetical protein
MRRHKRTEKNHFFKMVSDKDLKNGTWRRLPALILGLDGGNFRQRI